MKDITVLGVDLAKSSFAVCGMTARGKVVLRKSLSRGALIEFTAKLPQCLVAFEACGGSHYWARLFLRQGHQVKMMAVHRVKAFVPHRKKNDRIDAEAICLAALQETVPSVRLKGVEQQDIEILLNYRDQLLKQRVALINQVHAVGLEYGVTLPKNKTVSFLEHCLSEIENADNELSLTARDLVSQLLRQAQQLNKQIEAVEKNLALRMKDNESYQLVKTVPGVGPITAAAIVAHTGGDVRSFKNGRQFSAYLGLVPRQYSTGGRTKLLGITNTGQQAIRRLLVIGTRSVLRVSDQKSDRVSVWATEMKAKKGHLKASVALANKTARIIYAVLDKQEKFKYL